MTTRPTLRPTLRPARRLVASALALLTIGLAGCGKDEARDDARASLVDQMVEAGLTTDVADCVVSRFFEGKTNDELKAFYERDALTADERAEFRQFGLQCAPDTTGIPTTT